MSRFVALLHAGGASTLRHTLLDAAVGIGLGVLLIALFLYLLSRSPDAESRDEGTV